MKSNLITGMTRLAGGEHHYLSALEVKLKNKRWKSHAQLKKELGL